FLFEITIPNALYKYSSKYFLYFNFGSFPISRATEPLHNSVNLPVSSTGTVNTTKALNSPLTYVPNRPSLNRACFLSGLFLIASANKSVTLCVTLIFLPPFLFLFLSVIRYLRFTLLCFILNNLCFDCSEPYLQHSPQGY